jgi:tripartite ATP-independent transporter DctP family solute receptor
MNKEKLNAGQKIRKAKRGKPVIIFGVLVSILVLSLVFATCNKHITGKKIIIKVAHNGNEKHPHQAGFETFKEVLEKETGGRVEVQIFPNEQLGSEEEASQMVKLGLLSASAASAGGGLASFVSEAELFNLPFIFRDLEHFYKVLDGPIGRQVARAVEKKLNCVVLGYWYSGIRNAWNSKRPVLKPGDLKALKIRVMSSPILLETFNALGAQATPMAFGELYSALQMGVVDGAETDHIDLLYEKFHEVTKYVSYTNHMFLAVALIFSKKQFDRLPPDIQQAVLKAGRASVLVQREVMEIRTASALEELKKLGLKFYEVDKKPFRDKVVSVYKNNAEKVGGMQVIDEVAKQ